MTAKRALQNEAKRLSQELERLMQLAASRPGIADLLALSERYQAKLAEFERSTGRTGTVTITTTDSTA